MIEIVMDKERNLKNLKQIGTPREENKIYIENMTYSKIRENTYQDKRVFILMGHTERMEGRYATFVEAVVEVQHAEFSGIVPHWNNEMWSQVYREIKSIYEDLIIVGWAVDIKGMSPKITPELERVHREHFGGVHQVLFLMDSLERDEVFYIYKENKLVPKDGFYIYYRAHKSEEPSNFEVLDLNKDEENSQESLVQTVDIDFNVGDTAQGPRGRYRQIMQQETQRTESSSFGLVVAVAMLLFIIGVGTYENRDSIFGSQIDEASPAWSTETSEASTASGYEIPVETASEAGAETASETSSETEE